jgi:hypothetical protein
VTVERDGGTKVVACTLGPTDLAGRAARWEALAARAMRLAAETERGVRLVFATGPGVADELTALVALERDCCGFAAWSIRESEGELTLEIRGDGEEAIAAARALFPALRGRPGNSPQPDSC